MTPGADAPFRGRRVLAVAAYDSFLRSAAFYGQHLERRGAQVDYVLAWAAKGQLSEAQARAAGLARVPDVMRLEAIAHPLTLSRYDIVLLALDGARVRRFMLALQRHAQRPSSPKRPLVVSFYPGLIFRFHYEGLFCRMSADLLLLNSEHDMALYRGVRQELGLSADNAMVSGLSVVPSRWDTRRTPPAEGTILFVAQPTVPAWRHERMYLVDQLVGLAERFPDVTVAIKPRLRRGEKTLHKETDHYEDLLDQVSKYRSVPPNLSFEYGAMDEALARARVCVTVSSTAALEALAMNIPTRVLSDFGVHEHLGTQFFVGSGLLAELDQVRPDLDMRVNRSWLDAHLRAAADALPEVERRLLGLLTDRDACDRLPLPDGRLFGRPAAFDRFVREHFGEAHLSLVAEGRPRKRLWAERVARLRGPLEAALMRTRAVVRNGGGLG